MSSHLPLRSCSRTFSFMCFSRISFLKILWNPFFAQEIIRGVLSSCFRSHIRWGLSQTPLFYFGFLEAISRTCPHSCEEHLCIVFLGPCLWVLPPIFFSDFLRTFLTSIRF